jgi:hypothetical protein
LYPALGLLGRDCVRGLQGIGIQPRDAGLNCCFQKVGRH